MIDHGADSSAQGLGTCRGFLGDGVRHYGYGEGGVDKRERECVCVCVFGILVWDVERRSSGEKNACMVRCVRRGVFFFSLKLGEEETISQESLSWSLASSFSPVGGWYGCG